MTSNTKDWISYGSAIFMIVSGALLSFISFFMLHEVVSSVLIYLSEALTFAGGIYGVSIYFGHKFGEFASKARKEIDDRLSKIETR